MEGCELEFDDDALHEIAKLARKRETGARGLRAIVEELMLDVMYELPDLERKGRHYVTADVVRGERKLVDSITYRKPEKKSA
jgi:ATP-dependent Clp protease ATP-binding subunit ClpX